MPQDAFNRVGGTFDSGVDGLTLDVRKRRQDVLSHVCASRGSAHTDAHADEFGTVVLDNRLDTPVSTRAAATFDAQASTLEIEIVVHHDQPGGAHRWRQLRQRWRRSCSCTSVVPPSVPVRCQSIHARGDCRAALGPTTVASVSPAPRPQRSPRCDVSRRSDSLDCRARR